MCVLSQWRDWSQDKKIAVLGVWVTVASMVLTVMAMGMAYFFPAEPEHRNGPLPETVSVNAGPMTTGSQVDGDRGDNYQGATIGQVIQGDQVKGDKNTLIIHEAPVSQ